MIKRGWPRTTWVIVVGSWILVSCGKDIITDPPPPPLPECMGAGTVTVVVGAGTAPTFSWTPDCAVGRLVVEEGVEERWGTETAGVNTYASPITYNVEPPNSTKFEPGDPLVPGTTYRVTVFRWVTYVPESLEVLGSTDFVP
jgi:hypothetical protein